MESAMMFNMLNTQHLGLKIRVSAVRFCPWAPTNPSKIWPSGRWTNWTGRNERRLSAARNPAQSVPGQFRAGAKSAVGRLGDCSAFPEKRRKFGPMNPDDLRGVCNALWGGLMGAYYNEIDPYCAAWLRNLIAAGHLPAGDIDERSIVEVKPDDLSGYTQAHFFAGIGGWSYALRLAGWSDDRPVWTGSCPCQPLSCAGQHKGHVDERHLWPAFYSLIAECRPATIFGEQIASRDGREWLAAVRSDLEHSGYAVGAADLPAAGIGAPYKRQRLFWVANGQSSRGLLPRQSAAGPIGNPWSPGAGCNAVRGRDGSVRWLKSGLSLLVDGVQRRMAERRATGNAVVPQVAAAFVRAGLGDD